MSTTPQSPMPQPCEIVACYTPGDYEQEARERLLPSLQALNLSHDVRQIETKGGWVENGFACQEFLLKMHFEKLSTHLLFLDVDAVVHSDPWPFLLTLSCDLAAYWLDDRELLTGTLYLPAGTERERLLKTWIKANQRHPNIWDQKNLQALLRKDMSFRVSYLPPEYCCIFDLQRKKNRTPNIKPVIEHFQASRRFKKRCTR